MLGPDQRCPNSPDKIINSVETMIPDKRLSYNGLKTHCAQLIRVCCQEQ
jgi:hypothetical protein